MNRLIVIIVLLLISGFEINSKTLTIEEIDKLYIKALEVLEINVDSAFIKANIIQKASEEINYKIGIGKGYRITAKSFHITANYSEAYDKFNEALKIFETEKDKILKAHILRDLGELFRAMQKYEEALNYLDQSLDLSKDLKDKELLIRVYNRYSAVYAEKEDFEKSKYYLKESIKIIDQYNINDISKALIANTYNIYGGLYGREKNLDSAYYYLYKSLELSHKNNASYEEMTSIWNLIRYKIDENKNADALNLALRGIKLANDCKFPLYMQMFHGMAANACIKMNNFEQAVKYLLIRDKIIDSLFSPLRLAEVQMKVTRLKVDLAEKEKADQKKNLRNGLIIAFLIVFILLLITIGIYYFFKERHKLLSLSNKELSSKNKIIANQNDKLTELNATKDKFFSIIAHDLKNPIFAFNMSTKYIVENFDSFTHEELLQFLKDNYQASESVQKLLNNLLTWSSSQRGKIPYIPDFNILKNLADNSIHLLENNALQKNITITNNIPGDKQIYCDINQIDTVIRNILSNSIKFTNENGEIKINLIPAEDYFDGFEIRDNGVGMPQQKADNIFHIGANVSTVGTKGESGTGLGLIICKEFIDKHNGKISVESQEGVGTSFKIFLPKKVIDISTNS